MIASLRMNPRPGHPPPIGEDSEVRLGAMCLSSLILHADGTAPEAL
jgi:hypothetical protein